MPTTSSPLPLMLPLAVVDVMEVMEVVEVAARKGVGEGASSPLPLVLLLPLPLLLGLLLAFDGVRMTTTGSLSTLPSLVSLIMARVARPYTQGAM